MNDLNEVMRRLAEGIPPSPPEIEIIVADIRRQRAIYESGGKKARSIDDDALADVMKVIKGAQPPKAPLKRRF
jgi:hypothetical protein